MAYHPPADASDDEMRAAILRNRFVESDDRADDPPGPRDCVQRIPAPGGMVQLLAIDFEGRPGLSLLLPAEQVLPSDVEWLRARCQAMRPREIADLRLMIG